MYTYAVSVLNGRKVAQSAVTLGSSPVYDEVVCFDVAYYDRRVPVKAAAARRRSGLPATPLPSSLPPPTLDDLYVVPPEPAPPGVPVAPPALPSASAVRRGTAPAPSKTVVAAAASAAAAENGEDPRDVATDHKFFGGWHRHSEWLATLPIHNALGVVVMTCFDGQEMPYCAVTVPVSMLMHAAFSPPPYQFRMTLSNPLRPDTAKTFLALCASMDVTVTLTQLPSSTAATRLCTVPRPLAMDPLVRALMPYFKGVLVPAAIAPESAALVAAEADLAARRARFAALREELKSELDALAAAEGVELLAVAALPDQEAGFDRTRRGAWSHATKGLANADASTAFVLPTKALDKSAIVNSSGNTGSGGINGGGALMMTPGATPSVSSSSPAAAATALATVTRSTGKASVSAAVTNPHGTLPPPPPPFSEDELARMFATLEPPAARAGPAAPVAAALLAAESAVHELIDARARCYRWWGAGFITDAQELVEERADASRKEFAKLFADIRALQRKRALARKAKKQQNKGKQTQDNDDEEEDPAVLAQAEAFAARLQDLLQAHVEFTAGLGADPSLPSLSAPLPAVASGASDDAFAAQNGFPQTPVNSNSNNSGSSDANNRGRDRERESGASASSGALLPPQSPASARSLTSASPSAARARQWASSASPYLPTPAPSERRRHYLTLPPRCAPLDQRLLWLSQRVRAARDEADAALAALRDNTSEAVRGVPPLGRRVISARRHNRNRTPAQLAEEARFDRLAAAMPPVVASGALMRAPGEVLRAPLLRAAPLRGPLPPAAGDTRYGAESMAKEADQRWRDDVQRDKARAERRTALAGAVLDGKMSQAEADAAEAEAQAFEAAELEAERVLQETRAGEPLLPEATGMLRADGAQVYYATGVKEFGVASIPGRHVFMTTTDAATGKPVPVRVTTVPECPEKGEAATVLMWPPVPAALLPLPPGSHAIHPVLDTFTGTERLTQVPSKHKEEAKMQTIERAASISVPLAGAAQGQQQQQQKKGPPASRSAGKGASGKAPSNKEQQQQQQLGSRGGRNGRGVPPALALTSTGPLGSIEEAEESAASPANATASATAAAAAEAQSRSHISHRRVASMGYDIALAAAAAEAAAAENAANGSNLSLCMSLSSSAVVPAGATPTSSAPSTPGRSEGDAASHAGSDDRDRERDSERKAAAAANVAAAAARTAAALAAAAEVAAAARAGIAAAMAAAEADAAAAEAKHVIVIPSLGRTLLSSALSHSLSNSHLSVSQSLAHSQLSLAQSQSGASSAAPSAPATPVVAAALAPLLHSLPLPLPFPQSQSQQRTRAASSLADSAADTPGPSAPASAVLAPVPGSSPAALPAGLSASASATGSPALRSRHPLKGRPDSGASSPALTATAGGSGAASPALGPMLSASASGSALSSLADSAAVASGASAASPAFGSIALDAGHHASQHQHQHRQHSALAAYAQAQAHSHADGGGNTSANSALGAFYTPGKASSLLLSAPRSNRRVRAAGSAVKAGGGAGLNPLLDAFNPLSVVAAGASPTVNNTGAASGDEFSTPFAGDGKKTVSRTAGAAPDEPEQEQEQEGESGVGLMGMLGLRFN